MLPDLTGRNCLFLKKVGHCAVILFLYRKKYEFLLHVFIYLCFAVLRLMFSFLTSAFPCEGVLKTGTADVTRETPEKAERDLFRQNLLEQQNIHDTCAFCYAQESWRPAGVWRRRSQGGTVHARKHCIFLLSHMALCLVFCILNVNYLCFIGCFRCLDTLCLFLSDFCLFPPVFGTRFVF